jgi:mannose-6-phosphate isomerase-like protein (cupin superfamily)
MQSSPWEIFDIQQLESNASIAPVSYDEFFAAPSMHCGLYKLAKGATDMQSAHDEDELYYILKGKARIKIGEDEQAVGPGTMLYVRACMDHAFFEIEEDMVLIAIFANGG